MRLVEDDPMPDETRYDPARFRRVAASGMSGPYKRPGFVARWMRRLAWMLGVR